MAELATAQRALAVTHTGADVYSLLVVFYLAGQEYGLLADVVREIIRCRATTRVPNSSPFIDGVINLRGQIIPVFNLRRRLGLAEADPADGAAQQAVMIVECEGNDAGLLVDRVTDVVKIADSDVDRTSRRVEAGQRLQFIEGIVKLPGRLVTMLQVEHLVEE